MFEDVFNMLDNEIEPKDNIRKDDNVQNENVSSLPSSQTPIELPSLDTVSSSSLPSSPPSCSHSNMEDGVCVDCGQEIKVQEYDKNWNNDRKLVGSRTIYNELSAMGFPDVIVAEADRLYQEIADKEKTVRRTDKIACVSHAYSLHKEFGNVSIDKILTKFGIKGKKVFKGFQTVSKYSTIKSGKPIDFIRDVLDLFVQSNDHYDEIIKIYNSIKDHPKIDDPRPQSTAKALVFYYILKNNIDISNDTYYEKVKLSKTTIVKIISIICDILNTPKILEKVKRRRKPI